MIPSDYKTPLYKIWLESPYLYFFGNVLYNQKFIKVALRDIIIELKVRLFIMTCLKRP